MWYRNSFTKDKDEPLFAFQTQNNKNTKDPLPYKTAKCTQRGEIVHALYYILTIHYGFPKISFRITLNMQHALIPWLGHIVYIIVYIKVNRIRKCIVLTVDDFNCASHYQKNLQTWTFYCGNPLSLFVARNFLLIIEAVMIYFISFLSHQIFDSKTETKNEICILQKAVLQS